MPLAPRVFMRFLDGRLKGRGGAPIKYAVAGFLPLDIGGYLPAFVTEIFLDIEYAKKVIQKHNLNYADLQSINTLIGDSYVFREKPFSLTFIGYSPINGTPYLLVLKSAAQGREIWISTFHRTEPQQLRSKVKRALSADLVFRMPKSDFEE